MVVECITAFLFVFLQCMVTRRKDMVGDELCKNGYCFDSSQFSFCSLFLSFLLFLSIYLSLSLFLSLVLPLSLFLVKR